MASIISLRSDQGILGGISKHLRRCHLRGMLHLQHLLAVHDAQKMIKLITFPHTHTYNYKSCHPCRPPYSLPNAVTNVKPGALPSRPPRQGDKRDAEMGLVITRHPSIQRRIHEPPGISFLTQLTNAEEVVNGESKGELGEILIRCNNILYIRESN